MQQFAVHNPGSGQSLGIYEGATEREAIEACVKDAGYDSIEDMEQRLGSKCELEAALADDGDSEADDGRSTRHYPSLEGE